MTRQVDTLKWKITKAQGLDTKTKNSLLDRLHSLDKGAASLCHGDFHPLNIMRTDGKLWIIDWVDASCGDPLADACRTYVIFRQHIKRMAETYLRVFCEESGAKKEDILVWLPVVAAARLNENCSESESALLLDLAGAAK